MISITTSKKELARRIASPPTLDALYHIPEILDQNIRRDCATEVNSKGKNISFKKESKEGMN
ncbi:hypothetical protein TMatcc_003035 [Talaromyces marneffei ATCC 18224]